MEFYVIRDKRSGKFADGYYGWDANVLEDWQIFDGNRMPYIPNDEMEFIPVGRGSKPSPREVQLQLGLAEVYDTVRDS